MTPRHLPLAFIAAALLGAAVHATPQPAAHPPRAEGPSHGATAASPIGIPESVREEHVEIHDALTRATKLQGPVGEAARELAKVLSPHFAREEEIALPPLGLLQPLAKGPPTPEMRAVLPMTQALVKELPGMLEEHGRIGAAARRLEAVARQEKDAEVEELARKLQLHARTEEEVLYPAAVVVGRIVAGR